MVQLAKGDSRVDQEIMRCATNGAVATELIGAASRSVRGILHHAQTSVDCNEFDF